MPRILKIHFLLFGFAILLASCSSSKYIADQQAILKKNEIKFVGESDIIDKGLLLLELNSFIEQRPNSKWLLFIPRERIFLRHSEEGDNSWFDKWLRNDIGEPPTLYENTIALSNAGKMQKYLRNRKGYYAAKVNVIESIEDKKAKITYQIDLKTQARVGKVEYISLDTLLLKELRNNQSESLLKRGVRIDAATFDKEKIRINTLLQNRGFSNFSPNYITLKGDSTVHEKFTDIYIEINTPLPKTYHNKYRLKEVNIYTDYYQGQDIKKSDSITYNKKSYFKQTDDYIVKPSSLDRFIYLKKDEQYSRDFRNQTFKKLNNLEAFKYISLSPFYYEENDTLMGYNIFITPHEFQYAADFSSNVFYSTVPQNARRLIGIGGGVSLLNKNFRRGANTLKVNLEVTDEFQFDPFIAQAALTANLGVNLSIPKQFDMFGFAKMLKKLRLLSKKNYDNFRLESTTEIRGDLNIQNINRFYDITTLSANYGYSYRPNSRWTINIKQIAFDLNSYRLAPDFITRIQNNPFIIRSFTDNLLTGFFFRDIAAFYSSPINRRNYSWGLNLNFEQSGTEIFLADKLFNPDSPWEIDGRFEFAQYVKMSADYRLKKKINKSSEWASRLVGGVAIPFLSEQEIPYVKQFYVGGPNSLRGWQIRELGPGGNPVVDTLGSQAFFQQGDIYLEANLEYRFDFIYFTELAMFVDAGNVWTLREDTTRINTQFSTDFFRQIAVSIGWGLRFDFDYFLIRLDSAYRLRNPYPDPKKGNYRVPFSNWKGFGNVSVAINYPF